MYRTTSILVFLALLQLSLAKFYEPFQQQQQIEEPGGAYQFSYSTTSDQEQQEQDLAHSFREESRDEYGNVVGKYGYVDPNGHLRVVNYRAGADGYYAEGDTGVDQEALRQQRLLYSNDEATKIQQQAWQQSQLEQNGVAKSFPSYSSSSSASAAAAAAAAASASSSSSSSQFFNKGRKENTVPAQQDWTSVVSADNSGVIHQQYRTKGGNNGAQQRFYDRLVATPAKVTTNYYSQSNNLQTKYNDRYTTGQYKSQYSLPATRSYSQTKFQPAPVRYSAPSKSSYSSSSQNYISKTPTAHYTEQTHPSVFRPFNTHASSAASASASASASSSSFGTGNSFGSRTANYASGTKGGSSGIKGSRSSPVRAARYSVPGAAHATVNFKQFGPQPFQYSYSF